MSYYNSRSRLNEEASDMAVFFTNNVIGDPRLGVDFSRLKDLMYQNLEGYFDEYYMGTIMEAEGIDIPLDKIDWKELDDNFRRAVAEDIVEDSNLWDKFEEINQILLGMFSSDVDDIWAKVGYEIKEYLEEGNALKESRNRRYRTNR